MDRIGVKDNFFDVGGNSLLLVKVCAEINKACPHKLGITDLFTYTTISDLAAFMEKKASPEEALQRVHDRAEKQRRAMTFRKKALTRLNRKSEARNAKYETNLNE